MAFLVVRRLPVPRFGRSPEPTIRTLEALIVISTFLMLLPLVGRSGADTDAINGQVNFLGVATRGFPTVAMVASIVRALKKSNGAKIMDAWSASVLGTGIVLGLAGNSREGVFAPILAALVTPLFYGYRVKFQTMIIVAAAVAFVTLFISPALLIVRSERDFLSFSERIEKTTETIGLLIIRDPATIEATQRPLDYITYSVWGRYFGEPIPFSDRIGLIQTTDALASTAYGSSYVTIGDSFDDMVKSLFPNFVLAWFDLYVERTKTGGDRIASSLGLADSNAASFLAIPLDAESFATGGLWAVIRDSFLTYTLIFYILRVVTGQNKVKGVLPISLLLTSYHVCSEGDAGAIFYYALRVVPQFIISFHLVFWVARVLGASKAPDPI